MPAALRWRLASVGFAKGEPFARRRHLYLVGFMNKAPP